MAEGATSDFLAGVIEGFYGRPWTQAERLELFDWMAAWGLNTYLYAPKDDLKQRALWREPYQVTEADRLGEVIRACRQRGLRFFYALSPGLDIRYSSEADLESLRRRFEQMLALGGGDFALLFDDIPDRLDEQDIRRWGSLAAAQAHIANTLFQWVRERRPDARFLFCPTPYCGRMASRGLGGQGYLETIGRELLAGVDIFWTGPEIISREITVAQAGELGALLRRKPLVWDNLHANDYDVRRFYCGPYAGRAPELRGAVSGLLSNPNEEFALNYIPLRTLARYVQSTGAWDPRQAYLAALREWWPRFETIGQPLAFEDLVLFIDCYYLPHGEGPEAEALYRRIRALLRESPAMWGEAAPAFCRFAARLREFCARLAELKDRPLFYALSRRAWELREELDLLEKYVAANAAQGNAEATGVYDFHLLQTYRGGMVARLQRLLAHQPDGTFRPALNPPCEDSTL